MNLFDHINFLAVFCGTLAFVISGSLLYNPMHKWGHLWAEWSGMDEKMKEAKMTTEDMVVTFGGTILGGFFLATGMNYVASLIYQIGEISNGLLISLLAAIFIWLTFFGVATFVNATYSGASKKLVGLHMVNSLIELLFVGLVIGFFIT